MNFDSALTNFRAPFAAVGPGFIEPTAAEVMVARLGIDQRKAENAGQREPVRVVVNQDNEE